MECPKRNKLSALIQEEERPKREERRMGSLQLLNAIKAKVEVPKTERKGRMYVMTKVNGLETRALVDTGASHNFIEVDEAKRLGIQYEKERGWLKAVNCEAKPIFGVARGVKICFGEWCGLVDL